jgi:hypothetical protein
MWKQPGVTRDVFVMILVAQPNRINWLYSAFPIFIQQDSENGWVSQRIKDKKKVVTVLN